MSHLVDQLHSLRRSVRRRLVLYGLSAVLGGGMISFLTVLALDWFLWLPPALRIFGAAMFVAGFVAAMYHWVVRPLRVPMGLDVIADRLERQFQPLKHRLRSSLDFIERPDDSSEPMMRRVVEDTERVLRDIPLHHALVLQPLAVRVTWLAAGSIGFILLLLLAPAWIRTGIDRYLNPLGGTEWPRTVAIEALSHDQVVAVGDAATVRMRITRGLRDSLRAIVHFRDASGEVSRLTMQSQGDGEFQATLDAVTRDTSYWFEAGDENTMRQPFVIRTVRRPEVTEATAAIQPPPYAVPQISRMQSFSEGPVRAPVGGTVTVAVTSSKPLPMDTEGIVAAALRFDTGETLPLHASTPSGPWSTTLTIDKNLDFRIELRDELGFENRGAPQLTILAAPDAAPIVTLLEPRSFVECTPAGVVKLAGQIDDDFGIAGVELIAEKVGGAEERMRAWTITDRVSISAVGGGVQGLLQYRWPLESLKLVPGDQLSYVVAATDNRALGDAGPQVGRSNPQRVKIISEVEFEIRLRDDIALLEQRVRQAMIEQSELMDRTAALVREDSDARALSTVEREALTGLSTGQSRLARRLSELAKRFQDLAERMEANQTDREPIAQLRGLSAGFMRVANEPMANAGRALVEARDQTEPEDQQSSLGRGVQAQEQALNQLRTLTRSMAQWGNFQGLVTRTRDLLDRQESLRSRTQELGQETLGKSVAELTPGEVAALRRVQRQQEQLATDVEQLLDRMKQWQTSSDNKDPAGAESIEAALRAAGARDVSRNMHEAAEALSSNRTAAANIDQKNAAEGMRSMIAALQEREARELAQLRKRLDRAEEQVAQLLREQEALRTATEEAASVRASAAAFESLSLEQHLLRRNTAAVSDDLIDLMVAEAATRLIRHADEPMGRAVQALRDGQALDASRGQGEAIADLAEALEILHELAEQSAREEMRRTLAQIREDLKRMSQAQRAVNKGIVVVRDAIAALGRITRTEAREVTRLSREQGAVRDMVDNLRPDFEQVAVYQWALERIARWMDDSRGRLESRRVDDELIAVTARILDELERLAAAVAETESMPIDTDFVESSDGQGGSGPTQQATSVPPVTELLVLKALQADLLRRTELIQEELATSGANEERLRRLKTIGEDQAELRRLTEAVTQRSRQP